MVVFLLQNLVIHQHLAERLVLNRTPKVNLQKIPTISHVRYRNDNRNIPKSYNEKKRKAFGKDFPNYFPSMKKNYSQEHQHLLNEDSIYSVPPVDSNLHLEKVLNNRTMHDTKLARSDEPYGQKFKYEISSSLVKSAPHKLNESEMGSFAPNVEYAEQPTVQSVTKNGLIDMPLYQFIEPKLESEQLKNRREYSAESGQNPAFYIDEKGNVQVVKSEKNGENILPHFSLDRDLQTAAYQVSERYPIYNEKNNYPLKAQDTFKDFDRMVEKKFDKSNSVVDLEQAFQPDVDELPDFGAEKQPSSHLNIPSALSANGEIQNGEKPLSNRKQYDYFQPMQSQIAPVNNPQNQISVNKVYSPDAVQPQLRIQIPPLENLADAQPINGDLNEIDEGSFTDYENDVLKKPQFNNHEGKIGSEILNPDEIGLSDNKNAAKEIKTISKKIEESIQIEKHIPLSNKESVPNKDDLMTNNEYNLGGLKNDKMTQADLLDEENPYQSYSSTDEPEYEFNTENLNEAYAEFQKDLNQMKPFTDYSSDKNEQMESEFYSENPIKNIQNNYENEHLPFAQKVQSGLEKEEDPWLTTSSDEKFETDQSNPRIAAVEYSDLYLLDNGKNNKYEDVKDIDQPIRKLVKVSEIEVFSPKKLNDSREVIKDIDKLERVLRNSENAKDEGNAKLDKTQDTNENNSQLNNQFSTEMKSLSEEQNFYNEQPEVVDHKNVTANDDSYFRSNKIRKLFFFTYSHAEDESIEINNIKTDIVGDTKASENVTDLIFERTNNYYLFKGKIRPFIRYVVAVVVEIMKILAIVLFYIFILMLIVLLVFIVKGIAVFYSNRCRRRCHIYNINSEV